MASRSRGVGAIDPAVWRSGGIDPVADPAALQVTGSPSRLLAGRISNVTG
jgi:hypothetical protein